MFSLIHLGKDNVAELSEVVDTEVKVLLDDLQIDDIANFVNDHGLIFNKYYNEEDLKAAKEGEESVDRRRRERRLKDNWW